MGRRRRGVDAGGPAPRLSFDRRPIVSSLIAATDAILGRHVILIGLLIAGPCCGLLTGWARTATVGAWAIALAVVLGLPDGIWGTSTHLAFLGAVGIVALVSTSSAAMRPSAAADFDPPGRIERYASSKRSTVTGRR